MSMWLMVVVGKKVMSSGTEVRLIDPALNLQGHLDQSGLEFVNLVKLVIQSAN